MGIRYLEGERENRRGKNEMMSMNAVSWVATSG